MKTQPSQTPALGEALAGHHNSLGFLRLLFASAVLVAHASPLGGFGVEPLRELSGGQIELGGLAVAGFFAISGYVITKSSMHSDVVQFMWRRTLRIFPAFWAVLLASALLLGPIISILQGNSLTEYFAGSLSGTSPYSYVGNNALLKINEWEIYDLFGANPFGNTINGSLWTLILEWQCYVIIAVMLAVGGLKFPRITIPLVAALFLIASILNEISPETLSILLPSFLANSGFIRNAFIFFIGSSMAVFSHQIPYKVWLALINLLVVLATILWGGFFPFGLLSFCYLVLFLGAWLPKSLHSVGNVNDYSYGIYIYAFIVQQMLTFVHVNSWGYVPYIAISWICSFGLAWLSWHLIEKRALGLKNWGPGKGVHYWVSLWRNKESPTT